VAEGFSDEQIALILNRLRLRTGKGLTWRADRVRSYRISTYWPPTAASPLRGSFTRSISGTQRR
jgi:hypothetical protein